MATAVQLVFFLYMLVPITVCDDVFKLVNSSVQLDTQKEFTKSESCDITWTFNGTNNIVKFTPSRAPRVYKDRVEFNEKTYSLTVKNLQKSDSGLYEAEVSDDIKYIVAKYQLHVLDPVENPGLTASLQSNDTCNVTLTCEAQNLSVTSHCYKDNCNVSEKKTSGDTLLFLSLYISNNFIICNHSNPVSWKNITTKIKPLCPDKGDPGPHITASITVTSTVTSIIISCVFLLFIIAIICWLKRRKTKVNCQNRKTDASSDVVNTVYEEVEPINKGGNKAQSIEMSENHATATTVYCTVRMPDQACNVSTANPGSKVMDPSEVHHNNIKLCETHQNQGAEKDLPQTIYATVNKAGKPVDKA